MDNNAETKVDDHDSKDEEMIQKPKAPRKPLTEERKEQLRLNIKKSEKSRQQNKQNKERQTK